jgi:hypothetical protein
MAVSAPAAAPTNPQAARPQRLPRLLAAIVAACVALAALSAAVLPTVPSYDPWAWIVWGREVFDPHLSFAVSGGPSWKPLPVCFTAVYGLFGAAAPTLWVITARAAGLLALVGAYRLGALLAARVAGAGGSLGRGLVALAGVIAAAGVILTHDWVYYMFRGTSEPMLVASCLWAVDRHLAGRRGSAFVLLLAASLIRPEAWPFLLVYGVWLWVRVPSLRAVVVLGWLAVPFFWFVPPWVGSGQPFLAASHAKSYNGHLGTNRFVSVMQRGATLQLVPVLVAGLVGVALGWWRGRDRVVLGVAACALAWWVLVVGMTLDGYPGLDRFFLPAAALTCVLAGVGVAALANRAPALLAPLVVVVLVGVSVPFAAARVSTDWKQKGIASQAVTRLDQLSAAVAAAGGRDGVYPCRSSFAAVNHGVQTALAWKLHVTLGRVGTSMRHQGVLFVGPWDTIDGQSARLARGLTISGRIARVGAWRVYRVTAPGADTRCVGS